MSGARTGTRTRKLCPLKAATLPICPCARSGAPPRTRTGTTLGPEPSDFTNLPRGARCSASRISGGWCRIRTCAPRPGVRRLSRAMPYRSANHPFADRALLPYTSVFQRTARDGSRWLVLWLLSLSFISHLRSWRHSALLLRAWRKGRESNPQGPVSRAHTVFKTGSVATSDCPSPASVRGVSLKVRSLRRPLPLGICGNLIRREGSDPVGSAMASWKVLKRPAPARIRGWKWAHRPWRSYRLSRDRNGSGSRAEYRRFIVMVAGI